MAVALNRKGQVKVGADTASLKRYAEATLKAKTAQLGQAAIALAQAMYSGDTRMAQQIFKDAPAPPQDFGRIGRRAARGMQVSVTGGRLTISTGATAGTENAAKWIEGGTQAINPVDFLTNASKRRTTKTNLVRSSKGTYYYTRLTAKGVGMRSSATVVQSSGKPYLIIAPGKYQQEESAAQTTQLDRLAPSFIAETERAVPEGNKDGQYRTGYVVGADESFLGTGSSDDRRIMADMGRTAVKTAQAALRAATKSSDDSKEALKIIKNLERRLKDARGSMERQGKVAAFDRFNLTQVGASDDKNLIRMMAQLEDQMRGYEDKLVTQQRAFERIGSRAGAYKDQVVTKGGGNYPPEVLALMAAATLRREAMGAKTNGAHTREDQIKDRRVRVQGEMGRTKTLQEQTRAQIAALAASNDYQALTRFQSSGTKRVRSGGQVTQMRFFTLSLGGPKGNKSGSHLKIGRAILPYSVMGTVQKFLDHEIKQMADAIRKAGQR